MNTSEAIFLYRHERARRSERFEEVLPSGELKSTVMAAALKAFTELLENKPKGRGGRKGKRKKKPTPKNVS